MRVRIRKGQDLSAALAAGRHKLGLTQAELAERAGVTRDYIGDLESGELGMRVTRLLRVLGELGAEISLTLPDTPDTPHAPDGAEAPDA